MTVIGVDDNARALRLHSCPSCGRHAWWQDGRQVDRAELLDTLRVVRDPKPAPAPAAPAPAVAAEPDPVDRRTELQRLLAGFTVHGTVS